MSTWHFKPCPFCGTAGQTQTKVKTYWTGRRSEVLSAYVMHWCPLREGRPQTILQVAGRDEADAVAQWNKRAGVLA